MKLFYISIRTFVLCLILFLFPALILKAQKQGWETFSGTFEGTKGEIEVNLALRLIGPVTSQPFLIMTAVKMNKGTEDGLASTEEMSTLHAFSNSVESLLSHSVAYTFAGNFTHNGIRINYFYATDTIGLRQKFTKMYAQDYPTYNLGLKIKQEKGWKTYFEFLFPGDDVVKFRRKEK